MADPEARPGARLPRVGSRIKMIMPKGLQVEVSVVEASAGGGVLRVVGWGKCFQLHGDAWNRTLEHWRGVSPAEQE